MHGRLHTTTAAIAYLRGAHAAPAAIQTTNLTTTPELFGVKYAPNVCCVQKLFLLRVGGAGRPRIRLPSASQKFSWCLASSADPKPFANKTKAIASKLGLNEQKPRALGPRHSKGVLAETNSYPEP
jgi:hypothetical protein